MTASAFAFGSVGNDDRFVGEATTHYADHSVSDRWLSDPGALRLEQMIFTIARADGAAVTIYAGKPNLDGHMMVWHAGTDNEFVLTELFRRANAHAAAERAAAEATT